MCVNRTCTREAATLVAIKAKGQHEFWQNRQRRLVELMIFSSYQSVFGNEMNQFHDNVICCVLFKVFHKVLCLHQYENKTKLLLLIDSLLVT